MIKKIKYVLMLATICGASYAGELVAGKNYKIIKSIYLTGEYIDRGNKVLSKETAVAYLDSYMYASKSYTAFKTEVPVGTIMTIIGPTPKKWYLFFQGDFYFVKLEPDLSQGLDIKLQLDRGMEGNLDGLNPEIFSRM
jgi:hypothetical protein